MDIQKLFNKWGINADAVAILNLWNESHRHYHNLNHLTYLIEKINNDKDKYSELEYESLVITAIFHDIVYDPKSTTNEEDSAKFFMDLVRFKNLNTQRVTQMILDTSNHEGSTPLSEAFMQYDMAIILEDYDTLLEWENGIYNEYKSFGDEAYKSGRISFLEKVLYTTENNHENILKLINHVKEAY